MHSFFSFFLGFVVCACLLARPARGNPPLIAVNFDTPAASDQPNAGSLGGVVTLYDAKGDPSSKLNSAPGASGAPSDFCFNLQSGFAAPPKPNMDGLTGAYGEQYVADTTLGDFTIVVWYQGAMKIAYLQRIFTAGSQSDPNASIALVESAYGFFGLVINGNATAMTSSYDFYARTADPTDWNFLAVSFSSAGDGAHSIATFYSQTKAGTMQTAALPFHGVVHPKAFNLCLWGNQPGKGNSRGTREFTGNIDNFSLYDTALNEDDIQAVHDAALTGSKTVSP